MAYRLSKGIGKYEASRRMAQNQWLSPNHKKKVGCFWIEGFGSSFLGKDATMRDLKWGMRLLRGGKGVAPNRHTTVTTLLHSPFLPASPGPLRNCMTPAYTHLPPCIFMRQTSAPGPLKRSSSRSRTAVTHCNESAVNMQNSQRYVSQ
jgi:hypothetical protein